MAYLIVKTVDLLGQDTEIAATAMKLFDQVMNIIQVPFDLFPDWGVSSLWISLKFYNQLNCSFKELADYFSGFFHEIGRTKKDYKEEYPRQKPIGFKTKILEMEYIGQIILSTLNNQVSSVTSLDFLRIILPEVSNFQVQREKILGRFKSFFAFKFNRIYRPSLVALSFISFELKIDLKNFISDPDRKRQFI